MHYLVAHKGFVFVSLTLVVIEINLIKGQCWSFKNTSLLNV